jgi:chaperonin cofactor prefoldin
MNNEEEIIRLLKSVEKKTERVEIRIGGLESRMSSIELRLGEMEDNIRKILKCVSHENADFEVRS